MNIPIENIYYLLCYAWEHLQEMKYANVRCEACNSTADLLARILAHGAQQLAKRGLHRDYLLQQERLIRLKGKVLAGETIRLPHPGSLALVCEFDELDSDILPNRIIATTLYTLMRHREVTPSLRTELGHAFAFFRHCTPIRLRSRDFRRIMIHRNMRHYRFLLNVCELAHLACNATRQSGAFRFFDFEEERMETIFEDFVRNFCRKEQRKHTVSRDAIPWDLGHSTPGGLALLPGMKHRAGIAGGTLDYRLQVLPGSFPAPSPFGKRDVPLEPPLPTFLLPEKQGCPTRMGKREGNAPLPRHVHPRR